MWKKEYNLSDARKYFTAKLAPKYSGPYTLKNVIGYNVYHLVDDKSESKGNLHVKDIKPCTHIIPD